MEYIEVKEGWQMVDREDLPEFMSAVVCHGPLDYRVEKVRVPEAPPGGLLVQVEAAGICASDIKCFNGAARYWGNDERPAWAETNVIPGHEFVGRVVGLDATARKKWDVEIGDRVVSEQIIPCGECRYCVQGQHWMCADQDLYGFKRHTNGALADFMVFPPTARVYKVDGSIPPAHAAFIEPLACGLHAAERAGIRSGDVVVVAGCGPIGLGMIAGAVSKNPAQVIALDLNQSKLDLATKCGADMTININTQNVEQIIRSVTMGEGADVYLEGTGHSSAVSQGLNLLRNLGTYVEYGVFGQETSVDWSIISSKELDIRGAHLGGNSWPEAIRLVEAGNLPLDEICTHQFKIDEFREAFNFVTDGSKSVKVTIFP